MVRAIGHDSQDSGQKISAMTDSVLTQCHFGGIVRAQVSRDAPTFHSRRAR